MDQMHITDKSEGNEKMSDRKNGTIELLRFVFCLAVLMFHISTDIYGKDWHPAEWGGVLRYGAYSIEFFFITSGYFMARHVDKRSATRDVVEDTWTFIWGKIKAFLPYHLLFNACMFLIHAVKKKPVNELFNSLSSFLLLPTIGFNAGEWLLGAEWYIGYMIFVMLLIYPVLVKWPKIIMRYVAPVLSLEIIGYLSITYDTIMGSDSLLVSLSGILLGVAIYPISQRLRDISPKNMFMEMALKIIPMVTVLGTVLYMISDLPTSMQPMITLFLAAGLVITFAEKGILSCTAALNKGFIYWLGNISLPIYMVQIITRLLCKSFLYTENEIFFFMSEILATVLAGIASMYVIQVLKKSLTIKRTNTD